MVDGSFESYGNFLRNKPALNAHSNNFAWPRAVATNCMQSKIQMCPDYTLIWLSHIPQSGKVMCSNFRNVVFNPWAVCRRDAFMTRIIPICIGTVNCSASIIIAEHYCRIMLNESLNEQFYFRIYLLLK